MKAPKNKTRSKPWSKKVLLRIAKCIECTDGTCKRDVCRRRHRRLRRPTLKREPAALSFEQLLLLMPHCSIATPVRV